MTENPQPYTAAHARLTGLAAKLLTRDEARRIAVNVAKLPERPLDPKNCESATKLLTRDEVRRIAANIAKLRELLSRFRTWGVR